MGSKERARDLDLLDRLDELPRVGVQETAWRVVRSERDPLQCGPSFGRWDLGRFDVLYTALESGGALAETHFHLSRQPVFPSTLRFTLHRIEVTTRSTLKFADLRALEPLGVDGDKYSGLLPERTQELGDAAAFLGFDGLIAPSARWHGLNLVVFCDRLNPEDLRLEDSCDVDWNKWRKSQGKA